MTPVSATWFGAPIIKGADKLAADAHVGRRAIALFWTLNPDYFEAVSLSALANRLGCTRPPRSHKSRPLLWNSRRAVCSHPGEVRVVSGIFLLVNLSLRDFNGPRVRPPLEADMAIGETEDTGPAVSAAR